jgi:hypothetical protein
MTFRTYKDGHGNTILSLKGINAARDTEQGEDLASSRSGQQAVNAFVHTHGSFERNGVVFTRSGDGGYSMRLAGKSFGEVLCSEANAKPPDEN